VRLRQEVRSVVFKEVRSITVMRKTLKREEEKNPLAQVKFAGKEVD